MAYEGLRLASDVSKRLAAHRATHDETTERRMAGLRLDKPPAATTPQAARSSGATPAAPAMVSALALKLALQAERARVAAVFASAASHGRERVCATLLSSPKNWSASAIVAELALLPTDATVAGRGGFKAAKAKSPVASKTAVTTSASESWDRTWDRVLGQSAVPKSAANASWDAAYDRAFGKAAPAAPVNAEASAAWDGAIANVSRGMARN